MISKRASAIEVLFLMLLVIALVAPAGSSMAARAEPLLAVPQTTQPCIEDFTSDTDSTMPGFASTGFSHVVTGNNSLIGSAGNYQLALFAGGMDVITFPGQTVTYVKVPFSAFSPGIILFQGLGDTLTARFNPGVPQFREASDTTLGDNMQMLGQIVKVTLITSETFFDNIEISPCESSPRFITVDVLVRPIALNPNRNDGLMKAVLLSNDAFDAASVNRASVRFGLATVPFTSFLGDEDEDGDNDLIFFFLVRDVGIQCGDTTIRLTGQTTSGIAIQGEGVIRTVACP